MIKIDQWLIRARERGQSKIVKSMADRRNSGKLPDDQVGIWDNIKPPEHYLDNLGLDDAIAN